MEFGWHAIFLLSRAADLGGGAAAAAVPPSACCANVCQHTLCCPFCERRRLPGKGLLDNISDWLLNFSLGARPSISSVAAEANGEQPEDVGSAVEAMETWLPSADPASGKHPHAPSRRTDAVDLGAALEAEDHQRRLMALGLAERCELLRRVGTTARYSPVVTADELPELQALVGDEHIFIIEWD